MEINDYRIIGDLSTRYALEPLGDLHVGNINADKEKIAHRVNFIKDDPKRYTIIMGDLADCITLDDRRFDLQTTDPLLREPDRQYEYVTDLLEPIKDKIIGIHCVTPETLALTENGWKTYDKLVIGENILTLNTETDALEYVPIEDMTITQYDGAIFRFRNEENLDSLVTSNHRVLYKDDRTKQFRYRIADNIPNRFHGYIPITRICNDGKDAVSDDWAKLLSWVITEGSMPPNRKDVMIYQSESNAENIIEITVLLDNLGLSYSIYRFKGRKERTNEQDWKYISVHAEDGNKIRALLNNKKEIPRFMLNASLRQRQLIFATMMKGDGCKSSYYTSNYNLALQFMELSLKNGVSATISTRDRIQKYNGYEKLVHSITYTVNLRTYLDATPISEDHHYGNYKGIVWCPTTRNGNFVALRNNKPHITGNTGNHDDVLRKKIAHQLRTLGYSEEAVLRESDWVQKVCRELKVPYLGFSAFTRLTFESEGKHKDVAQFKIFSTHGQYGGYRAGGNINRVEDYASAFDADVYLSAHTHNIIGSKRMTLGVNQRGKKLVERTQLFAVTGGFLRGYVEGQPSYVEQSVRRPLRCGTITIDVKPKTRSLNIHE